MAGEIPSARWAVFLISMRSGKYQRADNRSSCARSNPQCAFAAMACKRPTTIMPKKRGPAPFFFTGQPARDAEQSSSDGLANALLCLSAFVCNFLVSIRLSQPPMGNMRMTRQRILAATLVFALAIPTWKAMGQNSPTANPEPSPQSQTSQSPSASVAPKSLPAEDPDRSHSWPAPEIAPALAPLFDSEDSDPKFRLESLMKVLRDGRHEGWVLAAYPDPKTSRPLIGAGFSLDVPAREHIQSDPANPHTFLEPSSAELWQAAGLDAERLQRILDEFDRNLKTWQKKNYRKRIKTRRLPPQITEEEAMRLLRISAIQSVHNARAYCRDFDRLTASQQMALSQLVFQMGVNLEEFEQFLGVLNRAPGVQGVVLSENGSESQEDHWRAVEQTLIESQWAKRYTSRAVSVIAMLDPDYAEDPGQAERRVQAVLRPPVTHHRKKSHAAARRAGHHSSGSRR